MTVTSIRITVVDYDAKQDKNRWLDKSLDIQEYIQARHPGDMVATIIDSMLTELRSDWPRELRTKNSVE